MVTPCFVFDLDQLDKNLDKLSIIRTQTSCKVLLSVKGFSTECLFPYLLKRLDGISASGEYEARLGKEYHQFVSTFSPAYDPASLPEVVEKSDIIVFNSVYQYGRYAALVYQNHKSCGIRINPEYSELPEDFGANPCRRYSHLGIRKAVLPAVEQFGAGKIEGVHLHTMCGQNADTLSRTVQRLMDDYDHILRELSWINLGGGQLYGASDYDMEQAVQCIRALTDQYHASVIIEPCEGILIDCGYLVTTVLDIIHNEMDIAILDSSAVCHLPDAVYRGWKHDVLGAGKPGNYPYNIRLAGRSCYAGDIFGDYSFPRPLKRGDRVIFADAASYSAVKACMFNGLPLPSVALYSKQFGLTLQKRYGYDLFRQML